MRRLKKMFKDFLASRKHYIIGAGCAFNLAGNYYANYSIKDRDEDVKAIESDWNAVGQDLKCVMNKNPFNYAERKSSTNPKQRQRR